MDPEDRKRQRLLKQLRTLQEDILGADATVLGATDALKLFDNDMRLRIEERIIHLNEPLRKHLDEEDAVSIKRLVVDASLSDHAAGRTPDGRFAFERYGHLATVEKAARKRAAQIQMIQRLLDAELPSDDVLVVLDRTIVDASTLVTATESSEANLRAPGPVLAQDTLAAAHEIKELYMYLLTTFGLSGNELLKVMQRRMFVESKKIQDELEQLRPIVDRDREDRDRAFKALLAEHDGHTAHSHSLRRRGESIRLIADDVEWKAVQARLALTNLSHYEALTNSRQARQQDPLHSMDIIAQYLDRDRDELFSPRVLFEAAYIEAVSAYSAAMTKLEVQTARLNEAQLKASATVDLSESA